MSAAGIRSAAMSHAVLARLALQQLAAASPDPLVRAFCYSELVRIDEVIAALYFANHLTPM
jgi:hypothetical protein